MGEYEVLNFVLQKNKLIPITASRTGTPVIVFRLLASGGVYSIDEVEILTRREVELEQILINIQSVFPNTVPARLLTNEATTADQIVLNENLKCARHLLSDTPFMRLRRWHHREANRLRKLSLGYVVDFFEWIN
jgi:hypothetical protein